MGLRRLCRVLTLDETGKYAILMLSVITEFVNRWEEKP